MKIILISCTLSAHKFKGILAEGEISVECLCCLFRFILNDCLAPTGNTVIIVFNDIQSRETLPWQKWWRGHNLFFLKERHILSLVKNEPLWTNGKMQTPEILKGHVCQFHYNYYCECALLLSESHFFGIWTWDYCVFCVLLKGLSIIQHLFGQKSVLCKISHQYFFHFLLVIDADIESGQVSHIPVRRSRFELRHGACWITESLH